MATHHVDPRDLLVAGLPARDILETMPLGVLVIDPVGSVRYANALILELLGWTGHDYVGRSLIDMVVPENLTFAAEILEEGPAYYGMVLGPMRIRYQDDSGVRRKTDF